MEFRNIIIRNPARLYLKHRQLVIAQEDERAIPVEDISSLMLESQHIQISAAALERLTVAGVTVFLCDDRHLPSVQLLPVNQFYRKRKLLYAQFCLKKPVEKRMWQSIVRKKIQNQAKCLRFAGKDGAEELMKMAEQVTSGDRENREAVAAAYYFPRLFGESFTRGRECLTNAALNYGYAILRGSIARNLVMHGLEPCMGLHHCNELNPFNLADDLIEPYRPLVDLAVIQMQLPEEEYILTPSMKRQLFQLTNYLVRQQEKKYRVMISTDRAAASLANSIVQQENLLELPELIPLEEGRYE